MARTPQATSERRSSALTGTARPARIALTLGDPRGIGPEVSAAALGRFLQDRADAHVTVFGADGYEGPASRFVGLGVARDDDAAAGTLALEAIREAVRLCVSGEADAIVTGPVHKPSLRLGGCRAPGQTELLAELTGVAQVAMLMACERPARGAPLRVALATTHVPLASVAARLDADLLVQQATLVHRALARDWGIDNPRVALCALNPHASDGGLFGDEEARIYAPALASLAAAGLDVRGPVPADTVFTRALAGEFDAVVAPYHDVGMAAFKTATFGRGVNVTLGLPFVRTSPDHGTAFDIAGRGLARADSMLEALDLAERLSSARRSKSGVGARAISAEP